MAFISESDYYDSEPSIALNGTTQHLETASAAGADSDVTLRPCDLFPETQQASAPATSSTATMGRPSSAPALHRHVHGILNMRRKMDARGEKYSDSEKGKLFHTHSYCRSMDFNASFRDLEHSLQDVCSTFHYEEFSRRTRSIQSSNQGPTGIPGISVKTFFDLRCYVSQNEALSIKGPVVGRTPDGPTLHSPGSLMLLYGFYVRLYDCMKWVYDHHFVNGVLSVAVQNAVEMGMFEPVDPESELTYLDVLNMFNDMNVCPKLISSVQLQTIYKHVHPGNSVDDIFVHSGITLDQFTELLVITADVAFSRQRYSIPTKVERVKQLVTFLALDNEESLREALSDHWWRRSKTVGNFSEIGQVVLRERHNVKPKRVLTDLPHDRHLSHIKDASALKVLQDLTWVPQNHVWRSFKKAALDMGIMRIGTYCNFRMLVHNKSSHMMNFKLSVVPESPSIQLLSPGLGGVAPGAHWDAKIIAHPLHVSEWSGQICIQGLCHNGEQYAIKVPGYLKAVEARDRHPRAGLFPKKVQGHIHRRGDGPEALHKENLKPNVFINQCLGAEFNGVIREETPVVTIRKSLARDRERSHQRIDKSNSHGQTKSKSKSKSKSNSNGQLFLRTF